MARKSMNVVDLKAWIEKASAWATGRYITNIYFDKETDIILVKLRGGRVLLAEPGRRVHVTTRRQPPQYFKQDPLVVLARKYMRDRKLSSIGQIGFDRIVYFEASNGYRLVVELVPRGIAVLVSPEGMILAATRYIKVKDREVRPKREYTPPPARGKPMEEISADDIVDAAYKKGRLVSGLVSLLGVPGEVAEEAAYRVGIDYNLQDIRIEEAELIVREIKAIMEESLAGRGYIVSEGGKYVEADPFKPTRFYENSAYEVIEYNDLDEALEEYFESMKLNVASESESTSVESEREKLIASLERARDQAMKYRMEAERLKVAAEFISMNYHLVSRIIECLRIHDHECLEEIGVRIEGMKDDRNYIVKIKEFEIEVPVDVRSVDDLILNYFKKAGVLEGKAKRAESSRIDIEERLRELEIKAKARSIYERYKVRKRYWFERFHYTLTRNGFLVIGGRDASQNELLVRRYLEPHDIFMHADIHGAPAVIIKTRGMDVGEEDLLDAAVIAVAYSKAWKIGIGSARVFYVNADQVSLSPPTGEYLAKGGIMVYGRKKYLPPIPVRIWIGVAVDTGGVPRILQGSREIVSMYSIGYTGLIPGELKKIDVARELKKRLYQLLGEKGVYVLAVPDEDIASRIPGKSSISGTYSGNGIAVNLDDIASLS